MGRDAAVTRGATEVIMASVVASLLLISSTNVFAENCCRQQMVTGSLSLDGVYTLLEERPFIDLAPQDREICQSGCVYARSGAPGKEEYCFAESPTAATSCSAFGEAESLMLERKELVEEIDTLNRSYVLGLSEVATRKDVLNQVATAKDMVTELLQTSSRSARSADSPVRQVGEVFCSSTVALMTNLITALGMSNTEQTQVFAAQLISSPTLACSSAEREELSINLEEQVATLSSQLVAQLGLQIDGGETELQVDDSGELPLILQDNERLQMPMEEEDELPFALP